MTRHVISLVITSNDIPLNLPIVLTYHLVPDGSPLRLTFLVHQTSFIYCWELASYIAFVGKHSLRHPTAVSISTHQHPICWGATFFDLILLGFEPPLIALQLRADDAFIDPFSSQVGGLRCGEEASLIHTKL